MSPMKTPAGLKRIAAGERARAWTVDYSVARAQAIRWLGDRYLLARPINAKDSAWLGPQSRGKSPWAG